MRPADSCIAVPCLTRRRFAALSGAALAACGPASHRADSVWKPAWDRVLIEKFVTHEDHLFDPAQSMVTRLLGPEPRFHTRQRDRRAHPTRESLDYALALLELGGDARLQRASAVIGRVAALQEVDPSAKWYGLWGWYMEEPPARMAAPDWNWAGFNATALLLIALRHGAALSAELRERVTQSIRHAALAIARLDPNTVEASIAAMNSFVLLAAAELLSDDAMRDDAAQRLERLAHGIEESGSFAEYNSPVAARLTLMSLSRIRTYVRDTRAQQSAARIEDRLWRHLAARWDAPRLQFAGPVSRCASTDLGAPAWLEKALDARLRLLARNRAGEPLLPGDLDTAIHDVRCPEAVTQSFLAPVLPRQCRETFVRASSVQGTTWLDRAYSLGSVNRGDFWNQRRPILAYFGDASRPAHSITVRVVKDGADFASANLFSVQERNCVLALVNFRTPGGNRHVTLDAIRDGRFECGRLFLEVDVEGLPAQGQVEWTNGRLTLRSPSIHATLDLRGGRFGRFMPRARLTRASNSATLTVDLLPGDGPYRVVWSEVRDAWLALTLVLSDRPIAGSEDGCRVAEHDGVATLTWSSPAAELSLTALTRVAPIETHNAAFRSSVRA